MQDLRFAIRQLLKSPGFTAVAVLTLALGLTVNATVFFFVNDFFLRPLPAKDPGQLVVIAQKSPQFEMPFPFSYLDFLDFRRSAEDADREHAEMAKMFSGLMAYMETPVHLSRSDEVTARTWVHVVSNNYFTVLGIQPLHGRLFLPTEGQQPGADPIIVLTHEAWRTRFAADPRIVGQAIKLNGVSFTVVGVTPPGFVGASWGTALSGFVPATMLREMNPARSWMLTNRGSTGFLLMGRLQPGATVEQARAAANVVMARLLKAYPSEHVPRVNAVVMRESRSRPSPFVANYTPLIVGALAALSLLVLAVAVANVTNLLFTRAADRERELAIRGALGASRWQLLRQLSVESLLLALGAGVVGTIAALWIEPYLSAIGPGEGFAPLAYTGTDWRLFVFTFGASLATGLLTGLLPALKATRLDLLPRLNEGTRTVAGTRHALRSLLVIGQVAVSCVVLICAGLALRSLQKLSQVNLGFQPDHLLLASFDVGLQRYTKDQGRQFQTRLLEQVRTLPGVREASLAEHVPFDVGGAMEGGITAEGRPQSQISEAEFQMIPCLPVEHAFLRAAGIRIAEGRDFSARDDATTPRVAIINRVLAQHFWPDGSPLGKRLIMDGKPIEVVGVVGEGRFWAITDRARPLLFLALAQNYRGRATLVARTEGQPAQLSSAVERIVHQLDPDLPLYNVRTMEQQIASSPLGLMPLRMGAIIAGAQGLIALLLAALGIFGLVSFAVTRRTREIGIRMALGACTTDVLRLVTRQSFKLTFIGLACGLLLSVGLTRALTGILYGISPTDPVVFAGVVLLITAITLLACWLPARRATRVNPVEALRAE
jgi:predicted permease